VSIEFWLNDHDLLFSPFCTKEPVQVRARNAAGVFTEGSTTIPGEVPPWVRGVYWLAIARGEVQVNEPKLAAKGPEWKRFLLFLQYDRALQVAIDSVVRLGHREQAWRFVGEHFDSFNERLRSSPVIDKLRERQETRARRLSFREGGFGGFTRPDDTAFDLECLPPKVKP
jgi:hypothetical protein